MLAELARRGYATVEEPGRRTVKHELQHQGSALPWLDANAFLRHTLALAWKDLELAETLSGWVFFDRGLIDAASGLASLTNEAVPTRLALEDRYHRRVFLAPPWPEIYVNDPERQHGLDDAIAEYDRLVAVYPALGYDVLVLPKVDVRARADYVLNTLLAG